MILLRGFAPPENHLLFCKLPNISTIWPICSTICCNLYIFLRKSKLLLLLMFTNLPDYLPTFYFQIARTRLFLRLSRPSLGFAQTSVSLASKQTSLVVSRGSFFAPLAHNLVRRTPVLPLGRMFVVYYGDFVPSVHSSHPPSTTGQVSYGRGFPPPATPTTFDKLRVTAGRSPAGGPTFPRPLVIRPSG